MRNSHLLGGVAFYTGDKYPSQYKNSVFLLEYSQWWIRVAFKDANDKFLGNSHAYFRTNLLKEFKTFLKLIRLF